LLLVVVEAEMAAGTNGLSIDDCYDNQFSLALGEDAQAAQMATRVSKAIYDTLSDMGPEDLDHNFDAEGQPSMLWWTLGVLDRAHFLHDWPRHTRRGAIRTMLC